ncbi:MAG: helix-turn-helix domain-containing protein [Sporichthyaceae bacterium]|nr:helix-turn-helix domain-containing protein [Sporichthyaceae bacterium]
MNGDPIAAWEDRQLQLVSDAPSEAADANPLAVTEAERDRDQSEAMPQGRGDVARMTEVLVYDYERAAAALGISTSFLRKQVMAGRIMHSKLGRSVRFTRAHLDAYLAATEQPVVSRRHRRRL